MSGIYSVNTPQLLFKRLARAFSAFCKRPSEDGIFDTIFSLYHLREWICPEGQSSYQHKSSDELSKEESLHRHLNTLAEFEIVRALCNNAKHFNAKKFTVERTRILQGFSVGYGRCDDSLSVTHFLIDGVEIRSIFWPVYLVYLDYFGQEALPPLNDL